MTTHPRPLRIGLSARVVPSVNGGSSQALAGLAYGLGRLSDGDEEYVFLVDRRNPDWLNPYLGGNRKTAVFRKTAPGASRLANRMAEGCRAALQRAGAGIGLRAPMLRSADPFLKSLGIGAFYLGDGSAMTSRIPLVYNPHDLQHLHFPAFFAAEDLRWRGSVYPRLAKRAAAVVVPSAWGREDVRARLGVGRDRAWSIPWAAPAAALPGIPEAAARETLRRLKTPERFAFYPAQTWRHKNHLRLLRALALLRDRHGIRVPLVCSGRQNEHWPEIERAVEELRLREQVQFLGYVADAEVQALYSGCLFLVFPSLFEGGGLPVLDAFHAGAPVACSGVTSLPEYAGDAALQFDPASEESIADAVARLWSDAGLREQLRQRGAARSRLFTWERTARAYRAVFRHAAGRCTEQDEQLLSEQCS